MSDAGYAPSPEEEAMVRAFMRPDRRPRYVELLRTRKGRAKLCAGLAHLRDLDPRFAHRVAAAQQHPREIQQLLVRKGAPSTCRVMSESASLDGQSLALGEALDKIVGSGKGSLVSCLSGRLGYYESEDLEERYVLERAV